MGKCSGRLHHLERATIDGLAESTSNSYFCSNFMTMFEL